MNLRHILHAWLAGTWVVAAAATTAPPATTAPSASTPAATASVSDIIHVGGSDMLQTAVGEPLTRDAQQAHLKVKVDLQGSVPALTGLKEGKIQLAILAAPVGQTPAPAEFKAVLFCFQADYVIVNRANPLNALDLRQAASVFGRVDRSATFWGDLQLPAEWAAHPIIAYTTSNDDGVVLELFKNLALKGTALKATVHVMKTPQEMIKSVADSENAIGLGGFDPGPPNKVLQLSSTPTAAAGTPAGTNAKDAAAPTPENVLSGNYPLRLPFYLVYKPADLPRVLPLLQMLLNADYADYLRKEHFIPLPDTARNRALLELDKPN